MVPLLEGDYGITIVYNLFLPIVVFVLHFVMHVVSGYFLALCNACCIWIFLSRDSLDPEDEEDDPNESPEVKAERERVRRQANNARER